MFLKFALNEEIVITFLFSVKHHLLLFRVTEVLDTCRQEYTLDRSRTIHTHTPTTHTSTETASTRCIQAPEASSSEAVVQFLSR